MLAHNDNAILFFVKYPTPGAVKTRLAKSIGQQTAARVYRQLADNNFDVLRNNTQADVIVVFDPTENASQFEEWLAGAAGYVPQQGVSLGDRLIHAFQWAFDQGYRQVVVFGSDTLGLTTEIVAHSFDALKEAQVVVGPANDGGYYLIGLRESQPQLFENIDWSTSHVLSQTQDIIKQLNLKACLLHSLDDFDEINSGGSHERITH